MAIWLGASIRMQANSANLTHNKLQSHDIFIGLPTSRSAS